MQDVTSTTDSAPDGPLPGAGVADRRGRRSLLRDTRGAAMSEATIVAPVLGLILGALIYIHDLYGAKLDAAAEARQCALIAASNGCDGVPDRCRGAPGELSLSGEAGRGFSVLQRVVDFLSRLPRVGELFRELDRVGHVAEETSREVDVPEVLTGEDRSVGDRQHYVCGEKTRGTPSPSGLFDYLYRRYGVR